MRVLGESWCFCNGGGKSEKMKAAIFSGKSSAMARVNGGSTGFMIHRNMLLTTHATLPSAAAGEAAEIRLLNGVSASLFPHRFFITSSVLDLTIVGLDVTDGDPHVHYLKSSCSQTDLELGSIVYLLGYSDNQEFAVGEGKVVIATDNLIKISTEGMIWSPGSAGFDAHGNLAFMVCDPMKLASSPNTKSSSASSSSPSSWKRDLPMQFGIPIPVILDWLNQHWEGNLDELSKPKLPLKRLLSTSQRNDLSSASFTMRTVFETIEGENEGRPTSSNAICREVEHSGPGLPLLNSLEEGDYRNDAHVSGIPTPEIYESPKLNSTRVGNKYTATQIQLLDISFPAKQSRKLPAENHSHNEATDSCEMESTGSVNGAQNERQSNSDISELRHEYSSEDEQTMYSAETAESRNFPSPSAGKIQIQIHHAGRSQSCVNYSRWGPVQRCSVARGATLEKHRSLKVYSHGGTAGHRSNDYFSPTVSSIMKKRNSLEPQTRPRQTLLHTSPRWMF